MLNDRAKDEYSIQRYVPAATIAGVEIVELKRFHDDGGSMTELGRLTAGMHRDVRGFEVKQINFSEMDAGAIKAFHLHKRQTDVWFVPPASKMLVVLGDVRARSRSKGKTQRLVLGDGTSRLVRIPPGVAHGVRNLATSRGTLIYFVDTHFDPDPARCDEGRLPWDHFGRTIWEVAKG
jgi:dTDP-4-dehydrorhamnose 3,5-epimerase